MPPLFGWTSLSSTIPSLAAACFITFGPIQWMRPQDSRSSCGSIISGVAVSSHNRNSTYFEMLSPHDGSHWNHGER